MLRQSSGCHSEVLASRKAGLRKQARGRSLNRGAILAAAVCLIAGCAREPLPPMDLESRDQVCARSCLNAQSNCISQAGFTTNRLVANDVLRACRVTAGRCVDTCPTK
jgi:hypothetical protein